ncbi:MAG: translation elongation factor Ts [Elusimicrobia bacterium]|nr:translation elongation factor Ts [Elusimicrobiota bacterium]
MELKELIAELRSKTGAGMMDCKRALDESKGSIEEAVTLLRKKGLADMAKRAARVTKEGVVAFASDGKAGAGSAGAIIELNCETDFVAKTSEFTDLAQALAKKAASGEIREPSQAQGMLEPVVAKLKENMAFRRLERFEPAGAGLVAGYIHHGAKKGALLELSAPNEAAASSEALAELAKELNLQIVGASAKYLKRDSVPPADIQRERDIYTEVVRKEGKPEAQVPKIVDGKINKLFYQAFCLLEQMSVRDPKASVADLVKAAGAKLGGEVVVRRFVRYQLGE